MQTDEINAVIKAIEAAWVKRAESLGLKPSSSKYKDAEVEFFVGAMVVLNTLYPNKEEPRFMSPVIPPKWSLFPGIGRLIVDRWRINRTSNISLVERANTLVWNDTEATQELKDMAEAYILGNDSGQFLAYVQSLPPGE